MIFRKSHKVIMTLWLLSFSIPNFGQIPNFGTLTNFVLFTTSGAVGNTGVSNITGNIGANVGAITGFGAPSIVNGTISNADGVTAQCAMDLQAAYEQLSAVTVTNSTHAPAFGTGETLFAGVYSIGGAGSVAATLILDAQGDPNAIFIFKIAGAFTTEASAKIVLANGASACNVFWIAEGAISMATLTEMKGTLIAHPGAVSMGAGCNLEGRMFSTTGAVSVYGVVAINSCLATTSWTGAAGTADWFTANNWDGGVPNLYTETWIPSALLYGRVFPIIDTGTASVNNITIQDSATLTISNSTLRVQSGIINHGTIDASGGTVEMAGSQDQTIAANTFLNNALNHLIISNTSAGGVTLDGPLDVYGSLTYSGIYMTLNTNDTLTLKSTAFNTAWIGNMTDNIISGKVTVERYIAPRKAWQFLSIPTKTIQTIKQAWQEGAIDINSNPVEGYGTQITGNGGIAAGFDVYTAAPSMKRYNSANNSWIGISNTNADTIKATDGYMTFIRGDRTATMMNSPVTQTVLRSKGALYTGDQIAIPVDAGKFASIGNPYACGVDMRNISKSGMKDFFYVWDPNLGGSYGFGGYQLFSYSAGNYVVTPGSGSYGIAGSTNNYIESGKAFLVQADLAGGSLGFTENSKIGGTLAAARLAGVSGSELRTSLFGINADSTSYVIDGVLNNYDDNYSNTIDDMDAMKPGNASENLSIKTMNTLLMIERRQRIVTTDTIQLNFTNAKIQRYGFKFTAVRLDQPGLTAFLEDTYLGTQIPLNLNGSTVVNFTIENIPASFAPDRFRIVFIPAFVLPLKLTGIKAYQTNKDIVVEWMVENEINTKLYEIEKSNNGMQFTTIAVIAAINNSSHPADYRVSDRYPGDGYNYYRIKTVDASGKITYTNIVKVFIGKGKQEITISPNPVINGVIHIHLNNMPEGKYSMDLLNNLGQKMLHKVIRYTKGRDDELIKINKSMPHDIYRLAIASPRGNVISASVIY